MFKQKPGFQAVSDHSVSRGESGDRKESIEKTPSLPVSFPLCSPFLADDIMLLSSFIVCYKIKCKGKNRNTKQTKKKLETLNATCKIRALFIQNRIQCVLQRDVSKQDIFCLLFFKEMFSFFYICSRCVRYTLSFVFFKKVILSLFIIRPFSGTHKYVIRECNRTKQ